MSPIKGLSEQRRLPRIGKIHLGIKKQSPKTGAEYPTATDYFVVPADLYQYLGEQPTELPIMIPVEDDEIWCNQYYKCYSRTRGLTCRGDGVTCRRMLDVATGEKANRDTKDIVWEVGLECKGRECPDYQAKECKETMNLQFIMPDIPGLGVWQVDTSSINSIRNINSGAEMIRAVYKRISFIPLLLTLEPQEVINPDDGRKKTVRCLHLRARGTLRDLMLEAAKPVTELLLPPPAEDEAPLDEEASEKTPETLGVVIDGGLSAKLGRPIVTKVSPQEARDIKDAGLFAGGGTEPTKAALSEMIAEVHSEETYRSSIVERAQKRLGPDAYEKALRPYIAATFKKQGISDLNMEELGGLDLWFAKPANVDKWLAEQITLIGGVKPSGEAAAEATKVTQEVAAKSKPRAKAKPEKAPAKETPKSEKAAEPIKVGMDQVVKLGKEMRAKLYSDDEIKDVLFKATGKKAKWDNNDAPAIRKAIDEKEAKKAASQLAPKPIADEVEDFLNQKEQEE